VPALNQDDLRLTHLSVQAAVFSPPPASATPGQVLTPLALSPRDAAAIYGEIARFGFNSFQTIPGGVQIGSVDGISTLTLTGSGWSFTEDLSRSVFEHAADKLGVTIGLFIDRLPPSSVLMSQLVDLHATWGGLPQAADDYVASRFLKVQAAQVVSDLPGLNYVGGGVRLSLTRDAQEPLPLGIQVENIDPKLPKPADSIDIRIEPFFLDKTKLFVEVTGTFPPTGLEVGTVSRRVAFVRSVLWDHLAGNIALESGG